MIAGMLVFFDLYGHLPRSIHLVFAGQENDFKHKRSSESRLVYHPNTASCVFGTTLPFCDDTSNKPTKLGPHSHRNVMTIRATLSRCELYRVLTHSQINPRIVSSPCVMVQPFNHLCLFCRIMVSWQKIEGSMFGLTVQVFNLLARQLTAPGTGQMKSMVNP